MQDNYMGIFNDDFEKEEVVLGGGCFWCTEAVFKMLKGIVSVEPGYAGGHTADPAYDDVAGGKTGHAEVVKISYDPKKISFDDLLTVFFATHDPTTTDKQGADVGNQYRSVILYTNKTQEKEAKKFIDKINSSSKIGRRVVTHVGPLDIFYPAENHHKNYYKNHPEEAYCRVVINPKLNKVKEKFTKLLIHN